MCVICDNGGIESNHKYVDFERNSQIFRENYNKKCNHCGVLISSTTTAYFGNEENIKHTVRTSSRLAKYTKYSSNPAKTSYGIHFHANFDCHRHTGWAIDPTIFITYYQNNIKNLVHGIKLLIELIKHREETSRSWIERLLLSEDFKNITLKIVDWKKELIDWGNCYNESYCRCGACVADGQIDELIDILLST
jgi:hypothetical protein